jgi:hypothetical protein
MACGRNQSIDGGGVMNTPNQNNEAPDNTKSKYRKLSTRQARTMAALVASTGWISREQIDRIAGASNGPQIIMELRRKVTGHDGLDTTRMDAVDRDGKPCKPGYYCINAIGRERVAQLFGGDHGA